MTNGLKPIATASANTRGSAKGHDVNATEKHATAAHGRSVHERRAHGSNVRTANGHDRPSRRRLSHTEANAVSTAANREEDVPPGDNDDGGAGTLVHGPGPSSPHAARVARGDMHAADGLRVHRHTDIGNDATATSQRGRVPLVEEGAKQGAGSSRAGPNRRRAAEDNRLGHHQPSLASDIGGPWRQRSRSKATPRSGSQARRGHQNAGAHTPRHHGRSSTINPRPDSRIGPDSAGKADSLRAADPHKRSA